MSEIIHNDLTSLKRHQAACDSLTLEADLPTKETVVKYNCTACDKTYQSFPGLCRHRKECSGRSTSSFSDMQQCKLCERKFDSFQGLRQHVRKSHRSNYFAEVQGSNCDSLQAVESPITAEVVSSLSSPSDIINPPSQEGSNTDEAIPVQLQIANLDGFDADAPPTVKASPCYVEAVGEVQTNIEEGAKDILGDAVLGRGKVCTTCDGRFYTFSSLREHERSQHPELFVREFEYHPSAVSMEQQLEEMAAYEIKRGSSIKTMARDLDLTVDQVKYRKGLITYKVILRMFRDSPHLFEPCSYCGVIC